MTPAASLAGALILSFHLNLKPLHRGARGSTALRASHRRSGSSNLAQQGMLKPESR
jgi:hypothetical protein